MLMLLACLPILQPGEQLPRSNRQRWRAEGAKVPRARPPLPNAPAWLWRARPPITFHAWSKWKSRARKKRPRKASERASGHGWRQPSSARRRSSATAALTTGASSGSSLRFPGRVGGSSGLIAVLPPRGPEKVRKERPLGRSASRAPGLSFSGLTLARRYITGGRRSNRPGETNHPACCQKHLGTLSGPHLPIGTHSVSRSTSSYLRPACLPARRLRRPWGLTSRGKPCGWGKGHPPPDKERPRPSRGCLPALQIHGLTPGSLLVDYTT